MESRRRKNTHIQVQIYESRSNNVHETCIKYPPVPKARPLGHKTVVISDSHPGPLLINDDVIVPQGTSVEVIVLHLQHEASTRYY